MHGVSDHLTVDINELLEAILEIHDQLIRPQWWIRERLDYLNRAPNQIIGWATGEHDFEVHHRAAIELEVTINTLDKTKAKKYFDLDKEQPFYICPNCSEEYAFGNFNTQPRTAQLVKYEGFERVIGHQAELECLICFTSGDGAKMDALSS